MAQKTANYLLITPIIVESASYQDCGVINYCNVQPQLRNNDVPLKIDLHLLHTDLFSTVTLGLINGYG